SPRIAGFAAFTRDPSACVMAPRPPVWRKMPGCAVSTGTETDADVPPEVEATTATDVFPESDSGARTLSCSCPFRFSTRYTGTAVPSMVTRSPDKVVGHVVPGAVIISPGRAPKLVPKIVTMPPGAMPVWKLAAFVTPAVVSTGPFAPGNEILRIRLLNV